MRSQTAGTIGLQTSLSHFFVASAGSALGNAAEGAEECRRIQHRADRGAVHGTLAAVISHASLSVACLRRQSADSSLRPLSIMQRVIPQQMRKHMAASARTISRQSSSMARVNSAVTPAAAASAAASASARPLSSSLLPSSAAASAPRLFHSAASSSSSSSALLSPAAALADASSSSSAQLTKKMNLFTALNDAMSEALRTDPKVSTNNHAAAKLQRAPCSLMCCGRGSRAVSVVARCSFLCPRP